MKKMMLAFGRFMYGNWYGAVVVFVAVAAVLCGLQFATCCMGDLVPWPKDVHLLIMFATVANIGVAMIVSLCRRKWGRAIGLLVLCVAAYVGFAFVAFISYCVPTRMVMPPSREWTEATICQPSAIEYDNLTFLGGISTRDCCCVCRRGHTTRQIALRRRFALDGRGRRQGTRQLSEDNGVLPH